MTSERQKAANRRNASRSTGPRTSEGKSASSSNSRRHGAYAKPDRDAVLEFYRLIIGDPVAGFPATPRSRCEGAALRLAEAEARLAHVMGIEGTRHERYSDALKAREGGASVRARPVFSAVRGLMRMSDRRWRSALLGNALAVPAQSISLFQSWMRDVKSAEVEWNGVEPYENSIAFWVISDGMMDAVDNAGRGAAPAEHFIVRRNAETARASALRSWIEACGEVGRGHEPENGGPGVWLSNAVSEIRATGGIGDAMDDRT